MRELALKSLALSFCGVVGVVLAVLGLAGCRPEAAGNGGSLAPPALVREYAQGQLSLRLTLDRQRLNSAQRLQLILEGTSPENFVIEFPAAEDNFGDFEVAGAVKANPVLTAAGRVMVRQSYTLEPVGPGELTIPALLVSSWQQGLAEAPVIELSTEPLPVTVDSLLAAGEGAQLSDIAPPVAQPWSRAGLIGAGLGGLLLLTLLFYLWRRRAGKQELPPPALPPHLLADQALEALLSEGLLEAGRLKLFYERVSNILRQYIERRFGLQAPERTTEEFLAELGGGGSPPFTGRPAAGAFGGLLAQRRLLQDFLSHCDLVKFARYHPATAEVERSVALCRQFIKETAPVAGPATSPAAKGDGPQPPPIAGQRGAR